MQNQDFVALSCEKPFQDDCCKGFGFIRRSRTHSAVFQAERRNRSANDNAFLCASALRENIGFKVFVK